MRLHRHRLVVFLLALSVLGTSRVFGGDDTCFEFFQNLAPGESGACADFSFFGFDGVDTTDITCAGSGTGAANLDLFQAVSDLPGFFKSEQPVKSSVRVEATETSGPVTEFTVVHVGGLGMFPLSEAPPANVVDQSRFASTVSESQIAFQVHKAGEVANVPVEIELVQNLSLRDPIDNSLTGEIGTFFLYEMSEIANGTVLGDLIGSSKFDAATNDVPEFEDPFASGYEGFTTATATGPGAADVEFTRTTSHSLPLNMDLKLSTLSNPSIIVDGFEAGSSSPWSVDQTFTFRVSSPDPDVRFVLNVPVVVPQGAACFDFENIPAGTVFETGDEFEDSGINLRVGFNPEGDDDVPRLSTDGIAGHSGNEIFLNAAALEFSGLDETAVQFHFGHIDFGIGLSINGELTYKPTMVGFHGTTLGGVSVSVTSEPIEGGARGVVTLKGPIREFLVAGEYYVDHICMGQIASGDDAPLTIAEVTRNGNSLSILFTGTPLVTDWKVMGSTDMRSFPDDRTSSSTITSTSPGNYNAVVEVTGLPDPYFLRLQR